MSIENIKQGRVAKHPNPPKGWPDVAPVLSADDFCRGQYSNAVGRRYSRSRNESKRCIVGWFFWWFHEAFVFEEFAEAPPPIGETILDGHGAMSFNDVAPFEEVAQKWNEYIARLGYVIDNDAMANAGS